MLKVCSEATAEDSFAETRERRKLGMAMAAIIRIIATTIKSSIRENPRDVLSIGRSSDGRFAGRNKTAARLKRSSRFCAQCVKGALANARITFDYAYIGTEWQAKAVWRS